MSRIYQVFEQVITALIERTDPLWDKPVGCLYASMDPTSPAKMWGGTWESIKDRTIVGAGGLYAAGSTGGEAEVTLKEQHLAPHNHSIAHGGETADADATQFAPWSAWIGSDMPNPDTGGKFYDRRLEKTGGGQPHNNMMPYTAAYIWRRVA